MAGESPLRACCWVPVGDLVGNHSAEALKGWEVFGLSSSPVGEPWNGTSRSHPDSHAGSVAVTRKGPWTEIPLRLEGAVKYEKLCGVDE